MKSFRRKRAEEKKDEAKPALNSGRRPSDKTWTSDKKLIGNKVKLCISVQLN